MQRGIRFSGTLRPENDGYRFATSFVVSRKEFNIHYAPLEPFVRDDVRVVLSLYAKPRAEDRDDTRPPPPPAPRDEAPAVVPSTCSRRPRRPPDKNEGVPIDHRIPTATQVRGLPAQPERLAGSSAPGKGSNAGAQMGSSTVNSLPHPG